MIARQHWTAKIAFWATLLALDWILYFRHAAHFFQGDAIFMLNHRATSLAGYFREFVALNPSGWFRPLAMELIESAFFPVFGLSTVPYRLPVYGLFFLITVAVYKLALAL